MVRRLLSTEVKPVIKELGALVVPELSYWAPVNLDFLGTSWEKLCQNDACRAYGLFSVDQPVGIFLGMIVPDMNSGKLQGLEFLWTVLTKFRSRAVSLLRTFEKDCRAAGCEIVITGSSLAMAPGRMRALYAALGYRPHAEIFSKMI